MPFMSQIHQWDNAATVALGRKEAKRRFTREEIDR
jgi:hypothetical protein